MASEDLGYTILHHVNSLANDLIGPTIPRPASAPAPGLSVLTLPLGLNSLCPMYETSPLMLPIQICMMPYWNHWSILLESTEMSTYQLFHMWSTGTYHNTPYSYAKDGPNHKP